MLSCMCNRNFKTYQTVMTFLSGPIIGLSWKRYLHMVGRTDTGKSTITTVLKAIMFADQVKLVPFERFVGKSKKVSNGHDDYLGRLCQTLYAISPEAQSTENINNKIIKTCTGEKHLVFRKCGHETVPFVKRYALLFVGNELEWRFDEKDEAMNARDLRLEIKGQYIDNPSSNNDLQYKKFQGNFQNKVMHDEQSHKFIFQLLIFYACKTAIIGDWFLRKKNLSKSMQSLSFGGTFRYNNSKKKRHSSNQKSQYELDTHILSPFKEYIMKWINIHVKRNNPKKKRRIENEVYKKMSLKELWETFMETHEIHFDDLNFLQQQFETSHLFFCCFLTENNQFESNECNFWYI